MKKSLLFVLFIIFLLVVNNDVYALVDQKNAEIECVYANGIVIGMSYDKSLNKNTAYVKEYPVSKTATIDGDPVSNVSLYSVSGTINSLKNFSCPNRVYYWIGWEITEEVTKNEDGKTVDKDVVKTFKGVYSFSTSGVTASFKKEKKTGWWIFSTTVPTGGTVQVTGTNVDQYDQYVGIQLVGERIYLTDDIEDNGYGHTYKLYTENEQAVGSSKYAQIYQGTKNYIQVGKIITRLYGASGNEEYLCIDPSITTQDSNRGEMSYKFSSIRHKVSVPNGKTCSTGLLYVRTTETCKPNFKDPGESFCDKYSNTAFVLIDIIKIMQILVPAIVIILTGIEFGKIVLSGNIEEELPKRKKSIVIRLIVMIAFFFLPLIVQLIVSLAEGVNILDVSCLFNNGEQVRNEDLGDFNCVDESNGNGGNPGGGNGGNAGGGGKPDNNVNQEIK